MTGKPPIRHHYVPEFYLRRWADANGLLHRYAAENGEIRLRLRSPRSVGYKENLYRAPHEHLTEWQAQALETHFFSLIDSDAAKALCRLLAGDLDLDAWPPSERQGWVMFVRSLIIRSPQAVRAAMLNLRRIFEATLKDLEPNYLERRGPSDPTTFEAFRAVLHPEHPERAVMTSIAHAISSENVGLRILNAQWVVVDVMKARQTLLISDTKPAYIGLDRPNGHIMLPISPTKLFVAVTDAGFLDKLRLSDESRLVQAINQRTVGEASNFVVACDDLQSRFIENRFGRSAPCDR